MIVGELVWCCSQNHNATYRQRNLKEMKKIILNNGMEYTECDSLDKTHNSANG